MLSSKDSPNSIESLQNSQNSQNLESLESLESLEIREALAEVRTLDEIREILALSKNRYYLGGLTNWPIYEGIWAQLQRAETLMSLLLEHSFHVSTEMTFSQDADFPCRYTIHLGQEEKREEG